MAKPAKRRIEGTDDGGEPGDDVSTVDGEPTTESKKPIQSARVTPKGGASKSGSPKNRETSGRYTPPAVKSGQDLPSPMWVPVLMFSLFGIGLLVSILSYSEVLPGGASGWYLVGGLAAILGGIITSTQLR